MGRRLGQHFLNRKSTLDHIAEAACGERTPLVIEIGAGRGALTESLLERADKVVAIEVDPVLIHYLRQKFRDALDAGRLVLVESDILKTDLTSMGTRGHCREPSLLHHLAHFGADFRGWRELEASCDLGSGRGRRPGSSPNPAAGITDT